LGVSTRQAAQIVRVNKTARISNFLRTADQESLPVLNRANELRCLQQRIMASGVEPGIAAPELDDMKFLAFEVAPIDVCDLKFAAGRGAQAGGDVEHIVVVEVEAGDRPVRQELRRLLDDVDGLFGAIELQHAVLTRLADEVSEDGCTVLARGGIGEFRAEALAREHIVPQAQRNPITGHEIAPKDEGMGKPDRLLLNDVIELDPPGRPVAEQTLIKR